LATWYITNIIRDLRECCVFVLGFCAIVGSFFSARQGQGVITGLKPYDEDFFRWWGLVGMTEEMMNSFS